MKNNLDSFRNVTCIDPPLELYKRLDFYMAVHSKRLLPARIFHRDIPAGKCIDMHLPLLP